MSGPPLALPASRALMGWWHSLAALSPRRMWFAHLLLHRIEAPLPAPPPRPFARLGQALRGVLAARPQPVSLDALAAELAISRALLDRALAEAEAPAEAKALQRRTFWFTEEAPPRYLPLTGGTTPLAAPPAEWGFDLRALDAVMPEAGREPVRPEDGVILDRAEESLLCLVERPDGRVIGHATRADGWALGERVLVMTESDWLTTLAGPIGPEALKAAWQSWCQGRSLPGAEVEACGLELKGERLVVRPPAPLLDRLRATRSEALRGETWLLPGAGRVRLAARVEVAG